MVDAIRRLGYRNSSVARAFYFIDSFYHDCYHQQFTNRDALGKLDAAQSVEKH